jgi:branched-chain amino acid transport system substrate-binding protein
LQAVSEKREGVAMIGRRGLLGTAAAAGLAGRARAQSQVIKLGVLNDMSGVFKDTGGPVSLACVKQAVQDFGDHGFTVEVLSADHQNKPDIGVAIARQWFDRDGVDAVLDLPTSSVALAVNSVAHEKDKVVLASGGGTPDLTRAQCTPNTVAWTFDTYMLAKSTGGAMTKAGGNSWYFIEADYVFGQQLARDTSQFVKEAGGQVLGLAAYPFPGTADFSSFLLQAQASGAKVLGLANAGADSTACIKQAREFGLTQQMKLAGLLFYISDVGGLGLDVAQGLVLTETFYWDLNDRTRAFTARVSPKINGVVPGMAQAGCYGAALHYLKAVADLGFEQAKASGAAAVARMKAMPTDDDAFGRGSIRADGRGMFPAYLFEVKKPSESKSRWDCYKLLATTPPDQAFLPVAQGGCGFIKA